MSYIINKPKSGEIYPPCKTCGKEALERYRFSKNKALYEEEA